MAVCLEICETCSGKHVSLWSSRCRSWAAHPSRIGVHSSLRLRPFTLLAKIVQNKAQEWRWCQVIGQMADREGEFKTTTCRLNFLCNGKYLSHHCGSHPTKKWAGAFDRCCLLVWLFSHCLWLSIFSSVSCSVDTFLSKLSWPQQLDMSENSMVYKRQFLLFQTSSFCILDQFAICWASTVPEVLWICTWTLTSPLRPMRFEGIVAFRGTQHVKLQWGKG